MSLRTSGAIRLREPAALRLDYNCGDLGGARAEPNIQVFDDAQLMFAARRVVRQVHGHGQRFRDRLVIVHQPQRLKLFECRSLSLSRRNSEFLKASWPRSVNSIIGRRLLFNFVLKLVTLGAQHVVDFGADLIWVLFAADQVLDPPDLAAGNNLRPPSRSASFWGSIGFGKKCPALCHRLLDVARFELAGVQSPLLDLATACAV